MTRYNQLAFFSYPFFGAYQEMFRLGIQTSQMLISSGEVIFHRGNMIQQAMNGTISWTDPEFVKLWQEKITANIEVCTAISKSVTANFFVVGTRSLERNIAETAKALRASTLPYHKKAGANARRLRNKK